jgi:hypothetical protein
MLLLLELDPVEPAEPLGLLCPLEPAVREELPLTLVIPPEFCPPPEAPVEPSALLPEFSPSQAATRRMARGVVRVNSDLFITRSF